MQERIVETIKRQDVPVELLAPPDLNLLILFALIDWSIILASAYMMFHSSEILYPLWAIIIAGRLHGFGVILHDISHLNLDKKTIKMRLIEVLVGYPIASTANAMAYHHIRHHRHTLMDNDPYFHINKKCSGFKRFLLTFKKGIFFVPFWMLRSYFAPFALILPKLRNFYGRVFLQDVSKTDLSQDEELKTCLKEDLPLALFHLSFIFITLYFYTNLLYIYYIPAIPAGVFCIYRLLIEHEYDIIPNKSVYELIESTYDHHIVFWERILIGPRNIGFHCMHHIHPNVGLHALPKLREWYLKNSTQYRNHYLKN